VSNVVGSFFRKKPAFEMKKGGKGRRFGSTYP
jgi:hypothetical protein